MVLLIISILSFLIGTPIMGTGLTTYDNVVDEPVQTCYLNVKEIPPRDYDRIHQWDQITDQMSVKYDVPADLIRRIMWMESRGHQYALSPAGAMGLMQVMPFHFRPWQNPFKASTNIEVGTRVLREGYDRYGSWSMAIKAYLGLFGADYWGTTSSSYLAQILNIPYTVCY